MRDTMRAMLLVVAVVLSAAALSLAQVEQCPSYDTLDKTVYLPHPYDCSLFRRCQAGQPVLGHCPPGQHFNPGTLACDEPARSGCTAVPNTCSTKKPQSTCRYRCTCSKDQQIGACPSKLQFGSEFNVVDLGLHPDCEKEPSDFMLRGGRKLGALAVRNASATVNMCVDSEREVDMPHFADCTRGVRCINGSEETLQCPDGYHYNPDLGYCDEPEYVNCTTAGGGLSPSADCPGAMALSKCHYTCSCEVMEKGCPARLLFASTISVFDARKQPACLKGPAVIELGDHYGATLVIHPNTTRVSHCPNGQQAAPLYLPDPSNCGVMLLCHRGKERTVFCPVGMHFNPKVKKCGKPDPAICRNAVPPTAAPPSPPVAFDNLTCPAAVRCPAGSDSKVAHLTDCTLFCRCSQGTPTMGACPPGLHFNALMQTCDSPDKANCKTFCSSLASSAGGTWSPQSCAIDDSSEGSECRLQCNSDRQLIGSEVVKCTNKGWHGTGGLNIIPSCNTPAEVAVQIVNKINETMGQLQRAKEDAGLLFILDESGSVGSDNFQIEKDFVAALVTAFPLSQGRSAGLITFQDNAAIDISLTETSTCNFLSRLQNVVYSSGGTDMANALRVALLEINRYFTNRTTLAFAITDGLSQSDPVAAAQMLRNYNRILFTIGVAGYDRKQLEPISSTYKDGSKLFFGLPNFAVFKIVADYLKTTYNPGAASMCP